MDIVSKLEFKDNGFESNKKDFPIILYGFLLRYALSICTYLTLYLISEFVSTKPLICKYSKYGSIFEFLSDLFDLVFV